MIVLIFWKINLKIWFTNKVLCKLLLGHGPHITIQYCCMWLTTCTLYYTKVISIKSSYLIKLQMKVRKFNFLKYKTICKKATTTAVGTILNWQVKEIVITKNKIVHGHTCTCMYIVFPLTCYHWRQSKKEEIHKLYWCSLNCSVLFLYPSWEYYNCS